MSYLKELKVDNFRGFDKLQIEGFSKINLLLGKNNCGKTSILESLFLLLGMSNPSLPDTVNRIRGIGLKSPQQLKYLFHKLKFINHPTFFAKFDDSSERWLEISPKYQRKNPVIDPSSNKEIIEEVQFTGSTDESFEISGLDLKFAFGSKTQQKKTLTNSLILHFPEISRRINKEYNEQLKGVFIPSDSKDTNALSRFSKIVKDRGGDLILETMQKFDPRIELIQPLPDGIFFGLRGFDELVPSNLLGDGLRKFLNVITAISESKNSFILLDEIENGLHYSAHKLLWESILSMTDTFNVQVFITTHSIESITCLKLALEEEKYIKMQELAKVFTITETTKSGFKAYRYSFEALKDAIEKETELRS
jgi:AAA15 family ATPase/GTPase